MAKRRLSTVHLGDDLKEKIARTSCKNVEDILVQNPLNLMKLLRLSADQCRQMLNELYDICVPTHSTAFGLRKDEQKNVLRLGFKQLDYILCGGLHSGTITEFTGPAGVGKTQWCLYSAIQSILKLNTEGHNTAVIYIDTENAFRPERVVEIIAHKYPQYGNQVAELLEKILVYQPTSIKSFSKILDTIEVTAIENEVGVLIVDSIASLARKEITSGSAQSNIERTNVISSWAAKLKAIAQQLNICVIVSNQVTSRKLDKPPLAEIIKEDITEDIVHEGSGHDTFYTSCVVPALGNTWTHCVNTRLILQFTDTMQRQLIIAKSPVSPFATFSYTIGSGGIESQGESYSYVGSDPGLQKIKVQNGVKL